MRQSTDVFTDSSCHSRDEAEVKSENKVEENGEGSCCYELCVGFMGSSEKLCSC